MVRNAPTTDDEIEKLKTLPNLTLENIDSLYRSENKTLGWFSKRMVFSAVKLSKGELTLAEIFQRFIKYATYGLFILMPLCALLIKFFYRKRNYYYSEFLVFSIYFHTFAFGVLSIYILLERFFPFKNNYLDIALLIGMPAYLGFSLHRVFENSVGKTLFKTIMLSIFYCR